jgi:ferredoxin
VFPSPIGLLVHPRWGLWHAWRGALAFPAPIDLPPLLQAPNPCTLCPRPCLTGGRQACPVGTPYGAVQYRFHESAGGRHRTS